MRELLSRLLPRQTALSHDACSVSQREYVWTNHSRLWLGNGLKKNILQWWQSLDFMRISPIFLEKSVNNRVHVLVIICLQQDRNRHETWILPKRNAAYWATECPLPEQPPEQLQLETFAVQHWDGMGKRRRSGWKEEEWRRAKNQNTRAVRHVLLRKHERL